jgi:hypothetical protein
VPLLGAVQYPLQLVITMAERVLHLEVAEAWELEQLNPEAMVLQGLLLLNFMGDLREEPNHGSTGFGG